MKKNVYLITAGLLMFAASGARAQMKIGSPGAPDPSAMLEVTGGPSNNKGLLVPRISLTDVNTWGLSGSTPVAGMVVYNTNASATGGSGVGLYFWMGTQWVKAANTADWSLNGNSGTNPATNFIGTTDNQPLVLRTNNTEKARLLATGWLGLGTTNPSLKMTLVSDGGGAGPADDIGILSYGNSTLPALVTYTARGTEGAPANAQSGDFMGGTYFGSRINGANTLLSWVTSRYLGNGTTAKSDLEFSTNAVERMRIDSNGYVGIGTTDPNSLLSITPSADGAKITLWDGGSDTAHYGFGITGTFLNYHVVNNTASHRFFAGGKNGNGTELMRIQGDGNVGIGTPTPGAKLHVSGDLPAYGGLLISDTGGTNATSIDITPGYDMVTPAANTVTLDIPGIGDMVIGDHVVPASGFGAINLGSATRPWSTTYTQNVDATGTARIAGSAGTPTTITGRDASGNVGNVTVGAGLTLSGGVLTAPATATGWGLIGNSGTNPATNFIGTTDNQPLVLRTNNAEALRVTPTGWLGIGTTNPSLKMTLVSDGGGAGPADDIGILSYGNSTLPALVTYTARGTEGAPANAQSGDFMGGTYFGSRINGANTLLSWVTSRYLGNGTTAKSDLEFSTNAVERMRIDSNGYVGIGTTDPNSLLSITPSADGAKITLWDGGSDTAHYGFGITGTFLNYHVVNNTASHRFFAGGKNGNGTELMRIQGDGNVGIGTNAPTAKLSVNGTANNTTGTWGIFSDARIKNVDSDFKDGLATVLKIHPVKFHYKDNAPFKTQEQQIGIIAQEVEQIAPYMVTKTEGAGLKDLRQYNSQALPYLLVNAIQEQQAQIEELKIQNSKFKNENEALSAEVKELKDREAGYAELAARIKQMEQMLGVKENTIGNNTARK